MPEAAPVDDVGEIAGLLREGLLPHRSDYARWPLCFVDGLSQTDAILLKIWVDGASPTATRSEKQKLGKMLRHFAEMTEWTDDYFERHPPSHPTPEELVDLLHQGRKPPRHAYRTALRASSLPLQADKAALVTLFINGAARHASLEEQEALSRALCLRKAAMPFEAGPAAMRPADRQPAPVPPGPSALALAPMLSTDDRVASTSSAEVNRMLEAFDKLLAESPAAAARENNTRHYPLPLTGHGAASLLYQTVVEASTRAAAVLDMNDVAKIETFIPHLDAFIDAVARKGSIDLRDVHAMRAALPRVRTALGLLREFPTAYSSQFSFFARTLELSADSLGPHEQPTWQFIERLAGPMTQWVHGFSRKHFVAKGYLDAQMRMVERAAEVGLISARQKALVIDRVAQVLDEFHDWDGGASEPYQRPNESRRTPVWSNPQVVMRHLRQHFGFDDQRLGQLRDDIKAHVDRAPGALDTVAFQRKYAHCLQGTIGEADHRTRFRVLALAIDQALTGAFS